MAENNFEKLIITNEQAEKRIQEGIEKNRKGNFCLKLPISEREKSVHIKLKNHKFRFGANIFMLGEFDEEWKNEEYKNKFKEIFNVATLPFYWECTEPERGKTRYHKGAERIYRKPAIDLCMEYCEENGIEPREHGLCYTTFYPKWMNGMSFEEFKPLMEKRMQEISSAYANRIPTIEVTNEMQWHDFSRFNRDYSFYSLDNYIEDCFKLAEKYFPNNKLAINEGTDVWNGNATNRDAYYAYIEDTINRGGKVDLIGMQFHVHRRENEYYANTRWLYDVNCMFKILDKYSDFGKPIEITEITIPAHTLENEKEEEQADILEKLYSVWFSHPNVEKIIYWNLVDGCAFCEPNDPTGGENAFKGGLLRFDMSEKPAYKRIKRLIKEVWTTDETLTADQNGCLKFRGFYGEYEICVGDKTYVVNFDENDKEVIL